MRGCGSSGKAGAAPIENGDAAQGRARDAEAFDRTAIDKRPSTTIASQALLLMNNPHVRG